MLALAICLETTYPGCNGEHPWRMASVAVILVSVGLIALTLGCRLRGAESHAGVAEVVTGSEGRLLQPQRPVSHRCSTRSDMSQLVTPYGTFHLIQYETEQEFERAIVKRQSTSTRVLDGLQKSIAKRQRRTDSKKSLQKMERGDFRSHLAANLETQSYPEMPRKHAYVQLHLILVAADHIQVPVFGVGASMTEN